MLADDLVVEWPVSAERIEGRADFVSVNAEYPEGWSIEVLRRGRRRDRGLRGAGPARDDGRPPGRFPVDGPRRADNLRPRVLDGPGLGPVARVAGGVRTTAVGATQGGTTRGWT
ncbi:hypothetical protein [Streptomyces sp. H23]|uniref:hypothetical protein n=1 Tax=Streptomyces sp. H23 TaxID=2541723 RepID=UPI00320A4AF8